MVSEPCVTTYRCHAEGTPYLHVKCVTSEACKQPFASIGISRMKISARWPYQAIFEKTNVYNVSICIHIGHFSEIARTAKVEQLQICLKTTNKASHQSFFRTKPLNNFPQNIWTIARNDITLHSQNVKSTDSCCVWTCSSVG